jgi:osmoprotectant transport system permease protein
VLRNTGDLRLTAKVHNRVLLALLALLSIAALSMPLLTEAPNRLVSGHALAWATLLAGGPAPLLLLIPLCLLLALPFAPQDRRTHACVAVCASVLLGGLALLAGATAQRLAGDEDSLARVSFGGGFWVLAALLCLMASDAIGRSGAARGTRIVMNALVFAPLVLLLADGRLGRLSILQEYANRQDEFDQAVLRHLQILLLTLLPAVLLGVPLALAAARYRQVRQALFPVLNLIQTIPSLALFCLLLAPLAALARRLPWLGAHGVSGIGMTPAVIALVMYSLLPLVRSIVAGLAQVPADTLEAAYAMGLTHGQVLLRVEVPLALPAFLAGLRVTAVQAVGLTVVAALIGAGGLGGLVFQGLLSSALDLVLLGVIPVVALAVVVDSGFKLILACVEVPHDRV